MSEAKYGIDRTAHLTNLKVPTDGERRSLGGLGEQIHGCELRRLRFDQPPGGAVANQNLDRGSDRATVKAIVKPSRNTRSLWPSSHAQA